MGPISMAWFRDRGLTQMTTKVQEHDSKVTDRKKGDVYELEEIAISYSGGRIDIYGVPDEPYPIEYGLPIMRTEDWNDFSDWLDDLQTEELLSFEDILERYFVETGRIIRWWKDDEHS
jgi:hypothetical protein